MIESLQTLIAQTGERLRLRWWTVEPRKARPLRWSQHSGSVRQSLVGSLNCIHPNRLQVIGHAELAYLNALGTPAFRETIDALFAKQPSAILFSDAIEPSPLFFQEAARHDIPLIGSTLSDEELINHLHYFLTHALAERETLHGVLIEVLDLGVLLIGDAAIGKSELALDLISRGHRLIADDAPRVARIAPETLEGTCPEMLRGFLEVRGLGILNISAMFGESAILRAKTLNLIIDLQPLDQHRIVGIDRLSGTLSITTILEVEIPTITMPVAPGRNLAILVEAAARQQILRARGYDSGIDFIERQARAIDADPSGPVPHS